MGRYKERSALASQMGYREDSKKRQDNNFDSMAMNRTRELCKIG